jgi:hypothetical protein
VLRFGVILALLVAIVASVAISQSVSRVAAVLDNAGAAAHG